MKDYQFAKWTSQVPESEIRRLLKYNVKYYFGGGKPGALPLKEMINLIEEILGDQRRAIEQSNEQTVIDQYNYGPTQGLPQLRELLGNRICTKDKVPYEGDNPGDAIFISTGSQQALYGLLEVIMDPGDVVLAPSPAYLGFIGPATKLGLRIINLPTDYEGVIPEYIPTAIELSKTSFQKTPKMIYLVPDSDNPKGTTMPFSRRRSIYDIAEKNDILILEDAPYKEIQFAGTHIPPIKSLDKDNSRVAYLCSTSKEAAVFRLGYSMLPKAIYENLQKLRGYLDLCPSTFTQLIVEKYYRTCIDNALPGNLKIYENRCKTMIKAMDETFPSGSRSDPTGGFFIWWESQKQFDASKFLMKQGIPNNVIYTPGAAFYPTIGHTYDPDTSSLVPSQAQKNTMRLSFSYAPEELIDEGIRILGRLLSGEG